MEKIQTRVFNYGDEKEASWPPLYGTGGAGLYHLDKETLELKEGPPPPTVERYGQAPIIIQDTIAAYYHPAAEAWTDSRSALRHMDNATGTITTDKKLAPDPSNQRALNKARMRDGHEALHKAVAQLEAGTAPLTEETRALCAIQNEIISSHTGLDAFNAVGRPTNARGKRYRKN